MLWRDFCRHCRREEYTLRDKDMGHGDRERTANTRLLGYEMERKKERKEEWMERKRIDGPYIMYYYSTLCSSFHFEREGGRRRESECKREYRWKEIYLPALFTYL